MKTKLTLLIFALFCTLGAWATDVLPSAVVGTTAFQATALTTGVSGHTITKDGSGNVTISPNNSGYFGNNSGAFTGTLVIKINVPETPTAGVLFEFRTAPDVTSNGSQGLFMSAERVLATSWLGAVRADGNMSYLNNTSTRTLSPGEHTIIYIAGDKGAFVVADATSTIYFNDGGLKRSGIEYKVIYIPAAYAQYITEVHYFSDSKSDSDKTTIFSECSNHMHASQQGGTTASVASGKTLILDKAVAWTSLTGTGTVLQEVNIATTVAGSLPALTLKATAGTLTYTGTNLNGTTLDGVIIEGTTRITTSNTVTIKNLAGNNLSGTSNNYAFVGSGTLNFEGTCDLTKKSDGTDCDSPKLGYGNSNYINIKSGANVTTTLVLNTTTSDNNARINIESGATLSGTDIRSYSAANNGTMNGSYFVGPITLGDGSTTTLSYQEPFYGAVTVSGDATLNLTATTASLNQAITVAADKTLTIDGASNAVNLNVVPTMGSGSKINFQNATINYNNSIRNLASYTFTSCTAQFVETGDEYKAGGFTITNIPSGVTIKVKKYDATDYETVTPEAGTATISHEVGVSGLAAWLDYTFNESTKATNIHSPADQTITNAGNAGSGNNLTIDAGYNTDNSYNEDGTLKVMSTPWRNITWPSNYTVAVAGNVPDVENGCLVAFGSTTAGSQNYLAIIRGANQNEIKLVKGHGMNSAFEVISTMTAANATALSHLVVFTKNGNTFTVYLDGVQKTQVTYSDALGGGFQIGSIHGGVTGTGVGRVNDMSADIKNKIFAKAVRVYDYVISDDQMSKLTTEFPYTSFGGRYTRTITGNSNLSATDAWLNTGTQGYVNVPVNAVVEDVTYYPDVEITTEAASILTVNADMDVENIKFDGAGKLTIASDGEHNIHIYGSLTANGPISVKYGETDLSAVPVTIGESGSVEFDFSASDFSSVNVPTDYPVTGNTADYGSKVTGVYPVDDYHTYTLAHNGSTNSYILTVEPSVKWWKEHAIALVTPYYNGSHVGAGLGKYTISLGETSYANFADFGTAVMSWATIGDCVEPTIAINQPTSAFYRIKSGSKYLQDVRKSDSATQRTLTDAVGANESAETIFYLNDNTFVGYKTGFGFGLSVCQTQDTEHLNTQLFTESAEMGKYTIQSQQGTCASADYNVGYWGVDDSDLSREADAASGACWTIEEVTSLPITFSEVGGHGFASFYTPVAISSLPSGVKAYIASVDDDRIRFTNITDIPANTGVILYQPTYDSDPVNLTIGSASSSTTGNVLRGIVATTSLATVKTKLSASVILTMQNDGTKGLGFYNYTGTNLNGFKAFVNNADASGVKSFVFDFDDEDATGILTIDNGQLTIDNAAIYNVAGQRLSKMQKGINIVNGKKILK